MDSDRKHASICPKCRGNGYIRYHQNIIQLWNWGFGYSKVKDCETCHNLGEIFYDEPKIVHRDSLSGCPHN